MKTGLSVAGICFFLFSVGSAQSSISRFLKQQYHPITVLKMHQSVDTTGFSAYPLEQVPFLINQLKGQMDTVYCRLNEDSNYITVQPGYEYIYRIYPDGRRFKYTSNKNRSTFSKYDTNNLLIRQTTKSNDGRIETLEYDGHRRLTRKEVSHTEGYSIWKYNKKGKEQYHENYSSLNDLRLVRTIDTIQDEEYRHDYYIRNGDTTGQFQSRADQTFSYHQRCADSTSHLIERNPSTDFTYKEFISSKRYEVSYTKPEEFIYKIEVGPTDSIVQYSTDSTVVFNHFKNETWYFKEVLETTKPMNSFYQTKRVINYAADHPYDHVKTVIHYHKENGNLLERQYFYELDAVKYDSIQLMHTVTGKPYKTIRNKYNAINSVKKMIVKTRGKRKVIRYPEQRFYWIKSLRYKLFPRKPNGNSKGDSLFYKLPYMPRVRMHKLAELALEIPKEQETHLLHESTLTFVNGYDEFTLYDLQEVLLHFNTPFKEHPLEIQWFWRDNQLIIYLNGSQIAEDELFKRLSQQLIATDKHTVNQALDIVHMLNSAQIRFEDRCYVWVPTTQPPIWKSIQPKPLMAKLKWSIPRR